MHCYSYILQDDLGCLIFVFVFCCVCSFRRHRGCWFVVWCLVFIGCWLLVAVCSCFVLFCLAMCCFVFGTSYLSSPFRWPLCRAFSWTKTTSSTIWKWRASHTSANLDLGVEFASMAAKSFCTLFPRATGTIPSSKMLSGECRWSPWSPEPRSLSRPAPQSSTLMRLLLSRF